MSLKKSWKITINHLTTARNLLPEEMFFEEAIEFAKEFEESIEHNELELAMNSLDDLGLLCNAPDEFWHQLELSAKNMGLSNDVKRFNEIQNT